MYILPGFSGCSREYIEDKFKGEAKDLPLYLS